MELKILEQKDKRLVFQLIGADHTFCNALKKELVGIDGVEVATYAIEHPQIGIPKMVIQTTGKASPKSVMKKALDELGKRNKDFLTTFEKAVK